MKFLVFLIFMCFSICSKSADLEFYAQYRGIIQGKDDRYQKILPGSPLFEITKKTDGILKSAVIVHLNRTFPCSGSLIKRDLVLTALHCLSKLNVHDLHIEVPKEEKTYKVVSIMNVLSRKELTDSYRDQYEDQDTLQNKVRGPDPEFFKNSEFKKALLNFKKHNRKQGHIDWAILKLKEPVPESVVPSEQIFQIKESEIGKKGSIIHAGYPADKALDKMRKEGKKIFHTPFYQDNCKILSYLEKGAFFYTDCDIWVGQSGSPVFRVAKDEKGKESLALLGVFTFGERYYFSGRNAFSCPLKVNTNYSQQSTCASSANVYAVGIKNFYKYVPK